MFDLPCATSQSTIESPIPPNNLIGFVANPATLPTVFNPNAPILPSNPPHPLITVPNIVLDNLSARSLGKNPINLGNILAAGLTNLAKGSNIFLSNIYKISLLNVFAASFKGSNASLSSPSKPPSRTPFLRVPRTPSLNSSVVAIIPSPDPITALPRIPNGPPKNNDTAALVATPTAAPGISLAIPFLVLSSNLRAPDSPKNFSIKVSLFFTNPIAPPIIKPPIGPNGVINPGIIPAIPYLVISGRYLFIKSVVSLDMMPPALSPFSPIFSPNKALLITSDLDTKLAAAPTAPPISGPPIIPSTNEVTPPTNPPAAISGIYDFNAERYLLVSS